MRATARVSSSRGNRLASSSEYFTVWWWRRLLVRPGNGSIGGASRHRRVAAEDVVGRGGACHPKPAVRQVDPAAVHCRAEHLIGLWLQSVQFRPAHVQAVEAVGPEGAVGGWIENGCFVKELLKVRDCHVGPIPLLQNAADCCSGCFHSLCRGPGGAGCKSRHSFDGTCDGGRSTAIHPRQETAYDDVPHLGDRLTSCPARDHAGTVKK